MSKKLKNYAIGLDSIVEAISFVDEPAIESDFIFLSEQKPVFLEKDDKHMVYGAALRPDFPIYRRFEGDEFYVTFSKECVEQLSRNFLKDGFQKNWTTDHADNVKGISVVESWIKTDMKHDKSIALGLDPKLELGTWFIGCHVENEDVWNNIKEGTFKGFSIESFCTLDEYNFNKTENKEMISEMFDEEGLLAKIKQIINEALGKSEDEPQEEVVEEAATEVIEEVHNEENSEDKIDASEEEPVVEETPEEIAEEVVETVVEDATSEEEVKEDLQAVIDSLNAKIDELNVEVEELRKENKKLGSQPTAEPVKMHSEKQNPMDVVRALREGTYFQK